MKRAAGRLLVTALAVVSFVPLLAGQAGQGSTPGQPVVIRAGLVVDPERGTAAANQVIVIENGKITSIGSEGRIPAGARTIDLSRYSVLPGLFDAHTHLCLEAAGERGNYFF